MKSGSRPAEHPPRERVVLQGVEQREQQTLAPLVRRLGVQDQAEAVLDDAVGVFVHRRDEQRFLVREVDVCRGAAEVRVARDVGDRRRAVPVAREAGDRGFEEDAPRRAHPSSG